MRKAANRPGRRGSPLPVGAGVAGERWGQAIGVAPGTAALVFGSCAAASRTAVTSQGNVVVRQPPHVLPALGTHGLNPCPSSTHNGQPGETQARRGGRSAGAVPGCAIQAVSPIMVAIDLVSRHAIHQRNRQRR